VVGVDLDEEMIAEAVKLAQEVGVSDWVTHRQANIQSLPFDDATLDACRAERLFQVLPATIDPHQVCAEVTRVLKPGGWFVALDADWGTWSLDSGEVELERRLARFFAERLRPNGYAGRQFRRLFARQGLTELTVELCPISYTHSMRSPFGGEWVDREALAAGVITETEQARWRASVQHADASDEFFATACMVMVAGRKR
jgi:ubiquinone/menaquinone biosynthesis C-methylase UbiE